VFTKAAPTAERARDLAGCAAICRRLDEPLTGTAPAAAVGWLLVEHPGPWPAFGLPADVPEAVARFAHQALGHGVRTQLIRRPDRTGRQVERPTLMIAGGTADARWLEQRATRRFGWARRSGRAGRPGSGRVSPYPRPPGFGSPAEAALLVCTHGRR